MVLQLPSQHQLQNEAGIVDVVVLSVVRILAATLIATSINIFNEKNIYKKGLLDAIENRILD